MSAVVVDCRARAVGQVVDGLAFLCRAVDRGIGAAIERSRRLEAEERRRERARRLRALHRDDTIR